MTDSMENNSLVPQGGIDDVQDWNGCTLEQLRRRRAVALVRRELGREKIAASINDTRNKVATNGMRGLLFSNNTIARLKTADYLLLGWRVASWLISLRNRKRR